MSESPESSSRATSTRSTLSILATRIAMFPLSFLIAVGVVRDLGAANYGIYSYLNLMSGFVLPLFAFGFGQGITYLVGSRRYEAGDVIMTCVAFGFMTGVLTAGLVGGLWWLDALAALRTVPFDLMVLVLIGLPLEGIRVMLYRLSMGSSWFVIMNALDLATYTVMPALLALFVIFLGLGLDGAVYAILGRSILLCLLAAGLTFSRERTRFRLRGAFLREGTAYGVKAWAGDLASQSYNRLDHLLFGAIGTPAAYGAYVIAAKVTELLWLPTTALGPVLFNRIASAKERWERILLTGQIHRTVIALVTAGALGLAAVTPWLIPLLFKEEGAGAVIPALILIPGTVAMVTHKVLTKYFGGIGHPEKSSLVTVIGAVVIAVLSIALIPWLEAEGAALASTVGYAVMALAALIVFRRMIQPTKIPLFLLGREDVEWAARRIWEATSVWRRQLTRFLGREKTSG